MRVFTPLFAATLYARYRMKRIFKNDPPHIQSQLPYLEQSLPNNVTIAMGLAMYKLAAFPEISECDSGTAFADRLNARDFSVEFLAAWDDFMQEIWLPLSYGNGCRCTSFS